MHKEIKEKPRMTINEAMVLYPDNYILMQMDSRELSNTMGTVLYIGDNHSELFSMHANSKIPLGLVFEGVNLQRSLGGIAVGE